MMRQTALQLDVRDPRWAALRSGHPELLPFHAPEWVETLQECYGFASHVVAIPDAEGGIAAGLPVMVVRSPLGRRRWVSLPFTDRCPPLLSRPADAAELSDALRAAAGTAGIGAVEVRAPLEGMTAAAAATTQVLDLSPGADAVQAGFSSAHRRNARKAGRSGVTLRRADCEDDIARVYYGLHLRTRQRLGVPVQPRRFFRILWRRMLARGLGHALLACHEGEAIAGAIFLYDGPTVVYKFGASDHRAWGLRPNNLLFSAAIRWSAESGYEHFDFGRSDTADAGLRAFKVGWGASDEPLVYSTLDARPSRGRASGDAGELLGQLIRHSPAPVCRAIGETLYRYAA